MPFEQILSNLTKMQSYYNPKCCVGDLGCPQTPVTFQTLMSYIFSITHPPLTMPVFVQTPVSPCTSD